MKARRRFLTKVASLTMGTLAATACSNENDETVSRTEEFENHSSVLDRQLLDAFVDTIVPKDQDPGAVEAGVTNELLSWFDEKEEEKEKAMVMLDTIDRVANNKFKQPYKKLSIEQREKVLDLTIRSRDKQYQPARNSIQRLRSRIIRAFYLSPTGWAVLGYTAPFPDGYPDYSNPPV